MAGYVGSAKKVRMIFNVFISYPRSLNFSHCMPRRLEGELTGIKINRGALPLACLLSSWIVCPRESTRKIMRFTLKMSDQRKDCFTNGYIYNKSGFGEHWRKGAFTS